jgi:hypothetical protein
LRNADERNADDQYPQPHAKYKHLYIVVRVDPPYTGGLLENFFSLTKAYANEAAARSEAERLNALNAAKRCYYRCMVVRLVEP